ncbi:MAG: ATP-binding protein, partial [Anaerolineales bacterium]
SEIEDQYGQSLKRIPVPLNQSIAGEVVLEDKVLVVNDVAQYPRHYSQADAASGFQTQSLLAVPMRVRQRVIGVLEAVNKKNGQTWTEDDVFYLEILSAQAAVAIENASLVARLTDAYDELSQLDKLKNDFIAVASHELRTPLGVVLGYASFLKEEVTGETYDHAMAILNGAMRIREILEDMTNLQYLNVGEAELEREIIPVAEVMLNALNNVKAFSDERGHRLHYSAPPATLQAAFDRVKVEMALTNVLNNAIKFSPDKSFVELSYDQHAGEIWLIVKDNGIGIEADQFKRIFQAFYQIEDHMTRRQNGIGLGLAIAKGVIEAHGGRIWVESPGLNQGTTFVLSLPV